MRRTVLILIGLLALALLIAIPAIGSSGDGGDYKVRGYFDNGSFVVSGEEVRVAGAKVGVVDSVDVSNDDEIASYEGGPHAVPGKAVVVMKIDDKDFTPFLADASCLIRPQSLIGEKYVDCTPTQPRAPEAPKPPDLQQIPDGQTGAGQYRLPLENNGKTVDLDLVQNIQRLPYRDRFRLILNELGVSLAGRGGDLGEVIDRANPALRQTDRVLAILAQQSRALASLASNGDAVLEPLARNRAHITSFFHNAAISGEATAERGPALEEGLRKFPETLHQVRLTMTQLKSFADQGTPLFTDLNLEGKDLSKATQKLTPFANLAIPAFKTLGDAAQSAGPKIAASDPVLQDLATLGSKTGPASNDLAALTDTFVKTGGIQYLDDFIYNTAGNINGYDQYGHYQRGTLQISACQDYQPAIFSGCEAFFQHSSTPSATTSKKSKKSKKAKAAFSAPQSIDPNPNSGITPLPIPQIPNIGDLIPPVDSGRSDGSGSSTQPDASQTSRQDLSMKSAKLFLQFLLGSGA
jgi:ABC-type transporter Mla subunit MlaD